MAALDFPLNPTTTSEVTTGDITWKWNGYAWYAVSESDTDLDNIFLSKVNNDTAAGLITFEKLTTHEGGVLVTDDRVTIKSTRNSQALNILPANTAFSDNNLTIEDRSAGLITVGQNDCSVPANCGVAGLVADASLTNLITTATSRVAGIESGVNSVNNRNFYNFYASGTAPNYFAGITRVSGSPTDGVSPHLNSGSDQSGVEITTDAINIGSKNTSVSNEPLSINRMALVSHKMHLGLVYTKQEFAVHTSIAMVALGRLCLMNEPLHLQKILHLRPLLSKVLLQNE